MNRIHGLDAVLAAPTDWPWWAYALLLLTLNLRIDAAVDLNVSVRVGTKEVRRM